MSSKEQSAVKESFEYKEVIVNKNRYQFEFRASGFKVDLGGLADITINFDHPNPLLVVHDTWDMRYAFTFKPNSDDGKKFHLGKFTNLREFNESKKDAVAKMLSSYIVIGGLADNRIRVSGYFKDIIKDSSDTKFIITKMEFIV